MSQRAEACGCFAPPDPTVPILQAGERILFAVDQGTVTAHIQIQYQGDAHDFGWLLPLPSVPTLELGTEALFASLTSQTQPRYFVNVTTTGSCGGFLNAPSAFDSATGGTTGLGAGETVNSPLVTQDSIGPYDYAVLRADSKDEMFNWLTANHYFIPTGTDETVGGYIHPGAYFLALKLKSGKSAGDIQPVVLHYQSDNPMIPIVLTSVAAQPNMGIQVWMLGAGRAIPRNYNHVVLNDAQIDWLNQAKNYNDVVIKAVSEAPEKHAFVTEFSGNASVMRNQLYFDGQFAPQSELAAAQTPGSLVSQLMSSGFAAFDQTNFRQVLQFRARQVLLAAMPRPANLADAPTDDDWLANLDTFLDPAYREQHPDAFAGYEYTFDAPALAAQLYETIVTPAKDAQALLDSQSTLTRLYTTLSPQDMTRDPVFSFNYSLPPVSRDHTANMQVDCGLFGNFSTAPATLTTEQGWVFHLNDRTQTTIKTKEPGALRVETLPEEGSPVTLIDNSAFIGGDFRACGCQAVDALGFGALGLLAMLRRRRV